jgi:hypothetical protein
MPVLAPKARETTRVFTPKENNRILYFKENNWTWKQMEEYFLRRSSEALRDHYRKVLQPMTNAASTDKTVSLSTSGLLAGTDKGGG